MKNEFDKGESIGGYDGLSKSIRAIECEEYGGMNATSSANWLRKWFPGISAKDVKRAFKSHEWHHCSSAYNRVDYYFKNDLLKELSYCDFREDLRTLIAKNRLKKDEIALFGKLDWKEFNYFQKKYHDKEFVGELTRKGDWIKFIVDGKTIKKNLLGKHCFLTILENKTERN